MELKLKLQLDSEKTANMMEYYLYRSEETLRDRPIVDGVYIQRNAVGVSAPQNMTILLEWTS